MDVITGVMAIYRFFEQGNDAFAYVNIAFIAVGIFLNSVVVIIQNKKLGWKTILYELMLVVLMLKPASNASRVADGNIHLENAMFEPKVENAISKLIEVFSESLPSSLLQTYAIFKYNDFSLFAIGSVASSAFAISFVSTTLTCDYDCDPAKRKAGPLFYGFMKDKKRVVVFAVMVFMTAAHVLMKLIACSLILRVSKLWFWIYLSGDTGLYWIVKIMRGDFR